MATKKSSAKKTVKKAVKKVAKKKATAKNAKKEPFKNYVTKLKAGDVAPAFEGIDQDGKAVSSLSYKGKKIILYFYPQDLTASCTVQACNLRDNFAALKKLGYEIIGVSEDGVEKHKRFEQKNNLPFRLIADTDHKVIDAYDVWGKKQFMGKIYDGLVRTTFVINENGTIDVVITRVLTKIHTQQILDALQAAGK
ncbi:thioredoxin-dependent thiol peroxidase [Lacibacter luteus]|uniref:thioredoxin-dependent peroxiredoxin n=1 Tax=Lacibacter luteus TaxID=2508719 RepID=A0A4Q1CHM4_9BACT|nr:thioredoxin-dependent thiol peroxidase [Lacibacter luteus]RXK59833.1 thioredoxin-dependent thiol peroxidase [Lacibacter luteus]